MKILVGVSIFKTKSSEISLRKLDQKYLLEFAQLTNDFLFQASVDVFDAFIISANQLSFYAVKKNVELFREKIYSPPLLIVDADFISKQRAELLRLGADDCLAGGICPEELMAKIEVFNRRPIRSHLNLLEHNGFIFDINLKTLSYELRENSGKSKKKIPISLRVNEASLIEFLFKNKSRIISKYQILDRIDALESEKPMNLVEVYIYMLRKKIRDATGVEIIETVRGLGYRLG